MVASESVEKIKQEIEEILESRLVHSIPPAMSIRLEELEDQLNRLLRQEPGEIDAAT
jgi:hypothetical protein